MVQFHGIGENGANWGKYWSLGEGCLVRFIHVFMEKTGLSCFNGTYMVRGLIGAEKLPATGIEASRKTVDPAQEPSNRLIKRVSE